MCVCVCYLYKFRSIFPSNDHTEIDPICSCKWGSVAMEPGTCSPQSSPFVWPHWDCICAWQQDWTISRTRIRW